MVLYPIPAFCRQSGLSSLRSDFLSKELQIKNPQLMLRIVTCAQDWIRTSTWFPTLRPEHSASTNFATWAVDCKYKSELVIYKLFLAQTACINSCWRFFSSNNSPCTQCNGTNNGRHVIHIQRTNLITCFMVMWLLVHFRS